MAKILELVGFAPAIPFWKAKVESGKEKETKDELIAFIEGRVKSIDGLATTEAERKKVTRQWQLR